MLEQNENIVSSSKQSDAPLCLILRERESTLKHLRFVLSVSLCLSLYLSLCMYVCVCVCVCVCV